jgi:hypothetical protein
MGVLLYCAAPAGVESNGLAGVGQREVNSVLADGIRFFYSEVEADDTKLRGEWKKRALEFHAALQLLFQQATIIPFRFPTVLRSGEELSEFVQRSAHRFREELERLQGLVQMEVVLELPPAPTATASSGTAFLQARQSRAREQADRVEKLRTAAGDLAVRVESISSGDGLRVCFLVSRERAEEFTKRMRIDSSYRVTGPWPPSVFVSRELQAEEVRRG